MRQLLMGLCAVAVSGCVVTDNYRAMPHNDTETTIQCVMQGELYSAGQWREMRPAPLQLREGWADPFSMVTRDGHHHVGALGSFDGVSVMLCPTEGAMRAHDLRQCATLTLMPRAFGREGKSRSEMKDVWRGQVRCG